MDKDEELWDSVQDRDNLAAAVKRRAATVAFVPEAIERARILAADPEWIDFALALSPEHPKRDTGK